jgi:hypothetical protein
MSYFKFNKIFDMISCLHTKFIRNVWSFEVGRNFGLRSAVKEFPSSKVLHITYQSIGNLL